VLTLTHLVVGSIELSVEVVICCLNLLWQVYFRDCSTVSLQLLKSNLSEFVLHSFLPQTAAAFFFLIEDLVLLTCVIGTSVGVIF
jgi:hypothetical protein